MGRHQNKFAQGTIFHKAGSARSCTVWQAYPMASGAVTIIVALLVIPSHFWTHKELHALDPECRATCGARNAVVVGVAVSMVTNAAVAKLQSR